MSDPDAPDPIPPHLLRDNRPAVPLLAWPLVGLFIAGAALSFPPFGMLAVGIAYGIGSVVIAVGRLK